MPSLPPISVIIIRHPQRPSTVALGCLQTQQAVQLDLVVVERGPTAEPADARSFHASVAAFIHQAGANFSTAANAGLAAARGEWVLFLRDNDRLVGDRILSESLNWMRKTEAGVVSGEAACNDGHISRLASHPNPLASDFLPASATFYRRTLFAENGDFDPTLQHRAAYDFHLRLWKGRVRFKPIPLRVAATATRPKSSSASAREEIAVRHRYFSTARSAWWDARCAMRGLLRR